MAAGSATSAASVFAAGHGPVEPPWLHTAGQIAGVALMVELLIALLIVAALMFGLAYGAWWLSQNVVPVIGQYSAQAQEYIAIAERGTDRVAHGVATFHGARLGIAAGLKAFFLPGDRHEPEPPAVQPRATPLAGVPPVPRQSAVGDNHTSSGRGRQDVTPRAPEGGVPTRQPAAASAAPARRTPATPRPAPTFRAAGKAAGTAAGRAGGLRV